MTGPLVSFAIGTRPEYLRQTLESWAKVEGDARFLFSCEPVEECVELCQSFPAESEVVVNEEVYKGPLNQLRANQRAAERDSWWVHCEDDVLVAPDILSFFQWAATEYRDTKSVAWMTANTHRLSNGPGVYPKGVFKGNCMTLCWATWADRWPLLERHWDLTYSRPTDAEFDALGWTGRRGRGFDWTWSHHLMPVHGVVAVKPCLSRVKHIGVQGKHSNPATYQDTVTDCFVSDLGVGLSDEWSEVKPSFVEQWL